MSALALDYSYRYQYASEFIGSAGRSRLKLATFGGHLVNPYFFEGRLIRPRRTADLLRALMEIVHSRFHIPAAMLARIKALADPVVTSSENRLRFEGFSGCCSVYARVDLLPEAVDGEAFGRGTTNVDFNAPTHSGGWIDPVTLVVRIEELAGRLKSVPEFDQALALLRLAPDRRAAALTAWQASPAVDRDCEFHRALSHALGAEQSVVGPTVSLWCAAARARGAWTNDPLVMAQHRAAGPDAGQAAEVQLKFHPADEHPGKIILTVKPQRVSLPAHARTQHLPAGKLREDFKLPDLEVANPNPIWLLHDGLCRFWLCPGGPLAVRWALTVWPANPDPLLAHGLFHLKSNIDWETKLWANRVYLQSLLPTNTPISPLARLVLVVGLAAKDSEESGIAVDVAITAIADGRLNGPDLGEMLRNVLLTGLFKVARWAKALNEIAGPTVLHAHTVCTALARVLTGDTACGTRDLALLLELLHELTLQTGLVIPAATRDWLERYVGTGKGAKAVKSILAASPVTKPEQLRELHLAALQARVDRVRNWGLLEAATEPQFSSQPLG